MSLDTYQAEASALCLCVGNSSQMFSNNDSFLPLSEGLVSQPGYRQDVTEVPPFHAEARTCSVTREISLLQILPFLWTLCVSLTKCSEESSHPVSCWKSQRINIYLSVNALALHTSVRRTSGVLIHCLTLCFCVLCDNSLEETTF